MDRKKVVFELVEDNAIVRRPCFICGGYSEKSQIVCEVRRLAQRKDGLSFAFSHEIDDILKGHIESAGNQGCYTQIPNWSREVPTWEQWEDKFARWKRAERRYVEAQNK